MGWMQQCSCFGKTSFDVFQKNNLKIHVPSFSHCYAHAPLANLLRSTLTRAWPTLRALPGPPLQTFFLRIRGAKPLRPPTKATLWGAQNFYLPTPLSISIACLMRVTPDPPKRETFIAQSLEKSSINGGKLVCGRVFREALCHAPFCLCL